MVSRYVLILALASSQILASPFDTNYVKYTPDCKEVVQTIPYKEAKGKDRELVQQILPYSLTIKDINKDRGNLELTYKQKLKLDEDELQLTTEALS